MDGLSQTRIEVRDFGSAEDRALSEMVMEARDPETILARVQIYYSDLNRADRTPRSAIYLHLGKACYAVDQLLVRR